MHAASVTTSTIESLEHPALKERAARTPCALRIRLSDAGLVPALSSHLTRMGFTVELLADDTIEVTPISPVNSDYDDCTMRAYVRAWQERNTQVEAELTA